MTRLSHIAMRDGIMGMLTAKRTWLSQFSSGKNKRPDFEIQQRESEERILSQAHEDYAAAAARKEAS